MEANFKTLLANVRPEEVTEQTVEILAYAVRDTNTVSITLPDGYTWSDFEYLESAIGTGTGTQGKTPVLIPKKLIEENPTGWVSVGAFVGQGGTIFQLSIAANSATTATASGLDSASVSTTWPMFLTGFKRRYSKASLAEITEAASKPNLFINTWHAGAKVRNQRGFDGDWSALAIGDYGLDMWLKTSATHKGFIVEAGSYKPSTKHIVIAEDGGILGEVISPADGGHWLHSFPFASDKFSIREGDIPLGWSPDTDSRLDECYKSHINFSNDVFSAYMRNDGSTTREVLVVLPVTMRIAPTVTATATDGTLGSIVTSSRRVRVILIATSATASAFFTSLVCDATIALSEVTDDAEHRVVWGA